jgi:thymidylate kinase
LNHWKYNFQRIDIISIGVTLSLIILEGLDRTGKSSVAKYYESQGFEVVHQSAPPKGMTADLYLEEQIQLVSRAAQRDIILDRSYYGELIWPQIYGREALLSEESLEVLGELEESVNTVRILMVDHNVEAHWQRCVDNKEPLTKPQFVRARALFSTMADKYGFVRKTLLDFPEIAPQEVLTKPPIEVTKSVVATPKLTNEQIKLETANAINDILSKRLVKQKGPIYDKIETNLRTFLNTELGKILGTKTETINNQFSTEEVDLLKFFCKKLKEKQ